MDRFDLAPDCVFSPQPMYVIGTKNEDGTPNFCVITWLGFIMDQTPHLMMGIGGSKRTKSNILRERRFSANLVSEDIVWLADYFGCTRAEDRPKTEAAYHVLPGRKTDVPTLGESHWVYECEVDRVLELGGSHLFLAQIKNIQVDEAYGPVDGDHIDLGKLRPVIYAPYRYYNLQQKLGECGEWVERLPRRAEDA